MWKARRNVWKTEPRPEGSATTNLELAALVVSLPAGRGSVSVSKGSTFMSRTLLPPLQTFPPENALSWLGDELDCLRTGSRGRRLHCLALDARATGTP